MPKRQRTARPQPVQDQRPKLDRERIIVGKLFVILGARGDMACRPAAIGPLGLFEQFAATAGQALKEIRPQWWPDQRFFRLSELEAGAHTAGPRRPERHARAVPVRRHRNLLVTDSVDVEAKVDILPDSYDAMKLKII